MISLLHIYISLNAFSLGVTIFSSMFHSGLLVKVCGVNGAEG